MRFYNDEIEQIRDLVKEERLNGNIYVTFCDNGEKLSIDDLAFFQDDWSANEYCYENLTDLDRYAITTVDRIIAQLENQLSEVNQIDNSKIKIMKQENYDYLQNQVKNAGFGEALDNELKTKMESGEPMFKLIHPQEFGQDKVEATLNFRKSDQSDTYYFNNYEVAIKQAEGSKQPAPKQTFYVGKDNNYSLDEAYNLLSHRFVNKDLVNATGESYNSWVKLNFKETETNGNFKMQHFGEKWGFDLQKALDKYPLIKQLGNESDRDNLVASLKKGNAAEVTLVQDGKEAKGYVVANAYARSVNVTDENKVRVRIAAKEGKSENQDQKENQGQKNGADENQKNNEKKSRKQGQGVS